MTDCTHGRMTKGIPNCYRDATHTGGERYPGPACKKHAPDDAEKIN